MNQIEVVTYGFLMLMQFDSPELCQAYAQNMSLDNKCTRLVRFEDPTIPAPLPRPESIERLKHG